MLSQTATQTVLFDLDGTLIDSSGSILGAYRAALVAQGCQAVRPLTPDIIGPPLGQTMDLLTGGVDAALRAALIDAFKAHYDQEGFKATRVFDGIQQLLAGLQAQGLALYIATNKRIAPTRSILAHLGWNACFKGVYALDALQPAAHDKGELLQRLLQHEGLQTAAAVYVGDRDEDAVAAASAGLHFERADWGFGGRPSAAPEADQVAEMALRLQRLARRL